MNELTRILDDLAQGVRHGSDKLLPLVYDELRRMAAQKLAHERPGQTLDATALVHEAYLRLIGPQQNAQWEGRAHFFGAAAEAMRRILVDRARQRKSKKHGGANQRVGLDALDVEGHSRPVDLLALHEALERLEQHDPQAAMLVKMRYFAGLSHQEAAQIMGIGRRTADRLWLLARTWLFQQLGDE